MNTFKSPAIMKTMMLLATGLLSLTLASAPAEATATKKKTTTKKSQTSASSKKKFKYLTPVSATAKPAGQGKRLKTAGAQNDKVSTNLVFDGSTVNGRYQSAGAAVAKVEQEKKMNELIGMRRDFKDRLAAEKTRLNNAESAN